MDAMIPERNPSVCENGSPRIAFIVTEYPKTTETFIMRDVMEFSSHGCELLIFSLTHFNTLDLLHDFAKPTRAWARDYAYFASPDVIAAMGYFIWRSPQKLMHIIFDMVRGSWRDPVTLLKSLFILPKSLRIAREVMLWQADHIHAAYAGHPATTAWIIKRMTDIPFSTSSHAHDLFETQALLSTKLPEAEMVRTISNFNKRFLIEHVPQLADRPPQVIHVGTYLTDDDRRVSLDQIDGFRILYVGSLEQRKGVDLLIRAFARVRQPDWRLEIVGDGPERVRLEDLARTENVSDSITFQGAQTNEKVRAAMLHSSLLVVPSRIGARNQTEGLPTVIVEAFSVRLPVVATRLTGIPEIVLHEVTGLLFELEDETGLGEALVRMASDVPQAAQWAEAGYALVEAEFDQKKNAKLLLDHIMKTLPTVNRSNL